MSAAPRLNSLDSAETPMRPELDANLAAHALSPSLREGSDRRSAAFEVKFLIDEPTALALESALRPLLHLDPHADPRRDNAYQICSIYLDTPQQDVLYRVGRHRFRKFRVRKYGDAPWNYLEQKTKRNEQVRKKRVKASDEEIGWLTAPAVLESWEGSWFRRQVSRWNLAPTCRVSYWRRAYFGQSEGDSLRLTFDRHLSASVLEGWSMAPVHLRENLMPELVVCEMKFHAAMPLCFRNVITEFGLTARGASKYRRSMAELAPPNGSATNA